MARLSFRCDEFLVGLVDEARGDVARERWLRKAVERAAAAVVVGPRDVIPLPRGDTYETALPKGHRALIPHPDEVEQALGDGHGVDRPADIPAPAEQLERPLSRVEAFRRATQR